MKYVFENRVATQAQIRELGFANCARAVLSKRLNELIRARYLRQDLVLMNGKAYRSYHPTEQGFELLWDSWRFDVGNPHFKSESPHHDIRLGEIRKKLEILECFVEFWPENMLQSITDFPEEPALLYLKEIQSDAALIVNDEEDVKHTFAVELELSIKSLERYERKLSQYYRTRNVSGVLYITQSDRIRRNLVKVDESFRNDRSSRLFFTDEKNVLEHQGSIIFTREVGNKITLW